VVGDLKLGWPGEESEVEPYVEPIEVDGQISPEPAEQQKSKDNSQHLTHDTENTNVAPQGDAGG
jgi:hypothetical protein